MAEKFYLQYLCIVKIQNPNDMKKFIFTLTSVFSILLVFAKNDLTPYQKAAIGTPFSSEGKYNFAGYDKFAQNYDSICRAGLPNLVNTQSDEEFSEKLQLFANLLKDGHTSIGLSADVTYAPISHHRQYACNRICHMWCHIPSYSFSFITNLPIEALAKNIGL